MSGLLHEVRHNPLLWLLVFVPAVFAAGALRPESHTLLFVLSVLAALVTNSGRSAWFGGALVLMVYLIFALTLYLLPPRSQ
jgi:Ca2+/H+ antiporter